MKICEISAYFAEINAKITKILAILRKFSVKYAIFSQFCAI